MKPLRSNSRSTDALWALGAFGALLWVGQVVLATAAAVPIGDESAHLRKAFELQAYLGRSQSLLETLNLYTLAGDAYPNNLYSFTQPFLAGEPSIARARFAQLFLSALHAGLGLFIAQRLWGRPAAIAYVALACFSPIVLAFTQIYLIDVALISMVGLCVLSGEASEGFKRPVATIGFVAFASAALLVKWTALVWLAVPTMAFCIRAVLASSPDVRGRFVRMIVLVLIVAVGGAVIVTTGELDAMRELRPNQAVRWAPLAIMGVGLLLTVGGPLLAFTAPFGRCVSGLVAILLTAGPWYALHLHFLLDRLSHEVTTDTQRLGASTRAVSQTLDTVRLLVPGGELLLALGLGLALWLGRNRLSVTSRVMGAAVAVIATTIHLPFNVRYLLPMVPLIAGAIVGPWVGLSRAKQWGLSTIVVVLVAFLSSGGGATLSFDTRTSGYSWITTRAKVSYPPLPLGIGAPPNLLTNAEVTDMMDRLATLCPSGSCRAHLTHAQPPLQDRALTVLAMTRGFNLQFGPMCAGPQLPLGRLRATIILCE